MPLATEVGLGPGDTVLDGDPAQLPTERGTAGPHFRPMFIVVKRSPISATAELLLNVTYVSVWSSFRRLGATSTDVTIAVASVWQETASSE